LQVYPIQGSEQQGDDCDRFNRANPPFELSLAISVYLTAGGFAVPLRSSHLHKPS
jgi:hypothetical protein